MENDIKRISSGRDHARGMVKAARALLRDKNADREAVDYLLAEALKNLQPIKRNRRARAVQEVEE